MTASDYVHTDTNRDAPGPDGTIAIETAAAEAYGNHMRHAVNAARMRCHVCHVFGIIDKALLERAKIRHHTELVRGQTACLRREDVSAGWDRYRDPATPQADKDAIRDILARHGRDRAVPVSDALILMDIIHGYDYRSIYGEAGELA